MKIFLDTANIDDIRELAELGIVDGVTTNPSLIAKSGRKLEATIKEITEIISGPVSAEVIACDYEGMVKEARELAKIASNVVVKVPITWDGLRAVKTLAQENIKTNVTLVFTENQALLAARAGASYVSPFVGRLDDINEDGVALVENIVYIFNLYKIKTEVIAASIRDTQHVKHIAVVGAHIATIPTAIIKEMVKHHLTDSGIKRFLDDYQQSITKA